MTTEVAKAKTPKEVITFLNDEPRAFQRLLMICRNGGTGNDVYRQFISEFEEMEEEFDARTLISALVHNNQIEIDVLSGTIDITKTGESALSEYALVALEDGIPQYLREPGYNLDDLLDGAYNIFQGGNEVALMLCTQQASPKVGQIIFSKTNEAELQGLIRFEVDLEDAHIRNGCIDKNAKAYEMIDFYAIMLTLAGLDVSICIREEILDEDYDEDYDEDDEPNFKTVHQIVLYDPKKPPEKISVLSFTDALKKLGVKP
tara:strand:+ start:122299 stop:123078 length:780 start_codon:yes stop_codon:yes gene_type:complete